MTDAKTQTNTDQITLRMLKAEIRRLDPNLKPHNPAYRAALVLLASLVVDHSVESLTAFTKVPERFVSQIVERCRANSIFTPDGKVMCKWSDDDYGGAAFWMDVNVALGFVKRGLEEVS